MIPTLNTIHMLFFHPAEIWNFASFGAFVDTGYTVGCTFTLPAVHSLFHPESELDLNHCPAPSTISSCLHMQPGWDQ